ncbi:unnamed protein product [marine sediment metagenome]|uniref:Serpin domain-containing protein n=1 Tax=marine sediment metagenome TaxID=412755 RepID=X1DVM4_9ZZZZ
MRKGRLIAVFVVLTIAVFLANTAFLCSCSREPAGETSKEEPDEKISVEESDEVADSIDRNLVSANTGFGFKIFKELILEDSNQNIFISPLSILLALAMTYNGSKAIPIPKLMSTLFRSFIPYSILYLGMEI